MEKYTFSHYLPHFLRTGGGERYSNILRYFFPELVTAFLLYSALSLFESYLIGQLCSTTTFTVLGMANSLIHNIVKLAEAFSVASTVLAGRFNGMHTFVDVGRTTRDTFWLTVVLGCIFSSLVYLSAPFVYVWYGAAEGVIPLGVSFLRLRAISILFSFVYLGLIGILRGIKNTRVPMVSFMIGAVVFVIISYVFVLGKFGFPRLGLQGAAIASIAQNMVMLATILFYLLKSEQTRKYVIRLFEPFKAPSYIVHLITLSLPVAIDKVVFAFSYTLLQKLICPMGKHWHATFFAIREVEKLAILPAIALAQVITLLVSNDFGKRDWKGITSNIRKVFILVASTVIPLLLIFTCFSRTIFSFFDQKEAYISLAVRVFPLVSLMVGFDLLQLIFSGALRGAGDVKTVMWVRTIVCIGYFWPVSYLVNAIPIANNVVRFILLYGLFYLGHGFMSLFYMYRVYGGSWHKFLLKESDEQRKECSN